MNESQKLPCPLCGIPLEIRKSVKAKPYAVCDACGMQMFVRKEAGIIALQKLVANGAKDLKQDREKLRQRVSSLEQELARKNADMGSARLAERELPQIAGKLQEVRVELVKAQRERAELSERVAEYKRTILRTCPDCGGDFQIHEELIKTSWFDGKFEGYRCPRSDCEGVASPLKEN